MRQQRVQVVVVVPSAAGPLQQGMISTATLFLQLPPTYLLRWYIKYYSNEPKRKELDRQ